MIRHLQKIIGFNNSFSTLKKEQERAHSTSNLAKDWKERKSFQSTFPIFLVFFVSIIGGFQDAYAQCNPSIVISGGRTSYCVSENVNFGLSVIETPAQDTFFGNGVTDINNTDHAAMFNPSTAGVGTFDINYVVQVGGSGCNSGEVATLSITVSPIANAGIDGVAYVCQETGATIDLFTGLSGTPMTTGTWATAGGVTPTGYLGTLNDTQIAALPTGTTDFFYTVAGMPTCPDSTSKVTLTVTALPTVTGISPIANVCDGNSAIVTVNGLDNKNYLISYVIGGVVETAVPLTSTGGTGTFTTRLLTTLDNGVTLTVVGVSDTTVTPSCDNTTIFESETLTVNAQPEIQGRDTTICDQGNFDLSLLLNTITTGGTTEYGDALGNYNRSTNSMVTPLIIGTTSYYVRDSNTTTGCFDTTIIALTVYPTPNIEGRDSSICNSGTFDLRHLLTGDSVDVLEYGLGTFGTYNLPSGTVNPGMPGTYFYYVRDSSDVAGCLDTAEIVLTITAQPEITGRDTAVCAGQVVDLSNLITRTVAGDSIVYGATLGNYGAANDSLVTLGVGVHTYFARDSLGGGNMCSDTAKIVITVHPQPEIQGRDTTICSGETVDLSTLLNRIVAGDSLEFGTIYGTFGPQSDSLVTLTMTDTFYVRDSVNTLTCSDTTRIIVTVIPTPELVGSVISICDGTTVDLNTLLTRTSTGDSLAFGTVFGTYGPQADSLVTPNTTTTYFIRDSIGGIGCADTAMVTVNVSPQPLITGRDTFICAGQPVDLATRIITNGSLDSLEYGTTFGNYGIGSMVNPTTGTNYYLRDSNKVSGCLDTAKITIHILASPNAGSIIGDNEICIGEMDTLAISPSGGTSSYTDTIWLSGSPTVASITDGVVTGLAANFASIRYVIEDSNGCQDTSNIHPIIVYPIPIAGNITGDTSLCLGTTTNLTANPSSGTGAYTINWFSSYDTVATINAAGVVTAVSPGITAIQYTVTDSKSCSAVSNQFMVRVDTFPTIGFTVSDADSTICAGDAVTFAASGGVMYEFLLNSASTGAASAVNTYITSTLNDNDQVRVVVTNMNGCVDTSGMIIMNVDTIPAATLVSDDADNIIGTGQNVIFTASGGNSFEFFVNNGTVQGPATFDTFAINTIAHLDTIMVRVIDGNSCLDTAALVMMVNGPPTAINDTIVIVEDTPDVLIAVQDNDTDPEGDGLMTSIITSATNGLDNTLSNDTIQYIPNMDFNGLDTIVYQVCDGFSNCDTATLFITVTPINDPPVTQEDTLYILEDAAISILDVLLNDSDPDAGDTLTISTPTSLGLGTALIVMDTSISYIPFPDSNGVDFVVYQVCDTSNACDVGILRIFITSVNDAPVANKDSIVINEDSMNVSVAILSNDMEPDGDAILIDSVYAPTSGGTAVVTNDTILYNPPANFSGLDSIQYTICDTALCDTTYLIINVLPINEAPVAVKDSVTIPEDTSTIKIALLANDYDVDGDIIVIDSLYASIGLGILSNDTLCYSPSANFNGLDSIKYIITDGTFKDSTFIIINVLPINDAPIAVNDTITIPEDINPAIIAVQANDSDPDGNLFGTTIITGPSNGNAVVAGGNVNYSPAMSFNGMDTITYSICDTEVPSLCDTATIFITIIGINDAPIAQNDTVCIVEDTAAILIAVEMNDTDVDGDPLTISIMTGATQSLIDSVRNDTIVYQPALNFNGLDSVQYQLSDGTLTDQAWVYIKIDPKNDAPVAVVDSITIPEDTTNVLIAVTINDNDVDLGDSLIATIVTGPTSTGIATIINDTTIVYSPPANFNGIDTIVYQVCDTSAVCDIEQVIITVQSVSDRPIAVDDAYTVPEDTTNVVIDVQLNDMDGDGDLLTTRIISTFMVADTLNGDSIIFSPTPDSVNVQLIAYEICDPTGLCDTGVVTITITPVNDAPIAVTDNIAINQDTSNVGIAAAANDMDIDDDSLQITIVTSPTAANGTASILGLDSILYTPLVGFSGLDTIHYTVCDTSNACDMGIVIVTVGFINTPPVAVDDNLTGIVEDAVNASINVILNDSDINGAGDSLKVTMIATPPASGGTATISGDSLILYTPPANFNGMDSLAYTVCDTAAACANAWVFFTVTSVNDKPVANKDTVYINRDTSNVLVLVKMNDTDADGDNLTVMTIGNSTQGITPSVVNDSILYSAPAGYVGVDEITYKVTDTGGLMDTTTLTIVIIDPNNIPPTANTDFGTTTPGNVITIDVQANDVEPDGDSLITTIVSGPNASNVAVVLNNDSIQYTPAMTFAGPDTIIYKVCDPSLTCATDTVFILVENTLSVSARVILEGPYDPATTWMHDSLRTLGFIPTTEPYSTYPSITNGYQFVHKGGGGNETINPALLDTTGANAIVDWVYLELLGVADTIPIASRSALLQRDGDIVDVDGSSPVSFDLLPNGAYFLSVRHRNHLGVMTDTAYTFSANAFTTIDFSQTQSAGGAAIYGEHPVDTISSRLVLWAGDGNSDRKIIYAGIANDRNPVFFDVITEPLNTESNYNHVSFGYLQGDYDMKGSAIYLGSANDPDVIFFNVFLHPKNNLPGNTPTVIHIIREQIPRK